MRGCSTTQHKTHQSNKRRKKFLSCLQQFRVSTKTPNSDEVEQSNKHSNHPPTEPPAASDGASFMYKFEATNQAIFNEYQHHLGDNSFLLMNEARRGKNEEKERTRDGDLEEDSDFLSWRTFRRL